MKVFLLIFAHFANFVMNKQRETYPVQMQIHSLVYVTIGSFPKLLQDLKSFVAFFSFLEGIIFIKHILAVRTSFLVKFGHLILAVIHFVLMVIDLSEPIQRSSRGGLIGSKITSQRISIVVEHILSCCQIVFFSCAKIVISSFDKNKLYSDY